LVGQTGDEVNADVWYTRRLEPQDFVGAVALGVASADCGALAINEGLHAKADSVHSLVLSFGEEDVGDLAWCSFESDFGAGRDLKGLAECGKDATKLRKIEQARGSATEVHSVYDMRKICPQALGGGGGSSDLLAQLCDVGFDGMG
jgi:hypothetical protein